MKCDFKKSYNVTSIFGCMCFTTVKYFPVKATSERRHKQLFPQTQNGIKNTSTNMKILCIWVIYTTGFPFF